MTPASTHVGDRPLGHPLGERHVQPVVDARGLGPPAPGRERVHRVLAAVRGDVVDDRRGAADRGGDACPSRSRRSRAPLPTGRCRCVCTSTPPGTTQATGAVDDRLAGDGGARSGPTAAIRPSVPDPQVGAPLPVDVEHGPAGQQHRPQLSRFIGVHGDAIDMTAGVRPNCEAMPVTVPESLDAALSALAADPGATVLAGRHRPDGRGQRRPAVARSRGRRRPGRRAARACGSRATRS